MRAQSEGYDEKAPKTANSERAVSLTDRARQLAREAAAGKRPEAYLFTGPKGRQLRMNLYRRFTRWSTTAPRKRPHMLRHCCASQWLGAGIPINQVAEWLGDDPRTVLKVYAHVLGEQQTIEGLRHLNELASGHPQDPRDIPENVNEHESGSKPRCNGSRGATRFRSPCTFATRLTTLPADQVPGHAGNAFLMATAHGFCFDLFAFDGRMYRHVPSDICARTSSWQSGRPCSAATRRARVTAFASSVWLSARGRYGWGLSAQSGVPAIASFQMRSSRSMALPG
ncbi:MAG: tyrosine-type recombinase/integrase [Microbacterium sp.]